MRAAAFENVPVAGLFLWLRLLMFRAVKTKRAIAERRIDECAMMRCIRMRMHIRPKIFAGDAEALRRNCLTKLQPPDKLNQHAQQADLLWFAQVRKSRGGERWRCCLHDWWLSIWRRLDYDGARIVRIRLTQGKTLALERYHRVGDSWLPNAKVLGKNVDPQSGGTPKKKP